MAHQTEIMVNGVPTVVTEFDHSAQEIDEHIDDVDIHVTAEDKQAWDTHTSDSTIHVTEEEKQNWDAKAPRENLLHNWYFADPINQRGQTEYTGPGYGIDRWVLTNKYSTMRVVSGGVELSAMGGDAYFIQYLDSDIAGKTLTVSVMVSGEMKSVTTVAQVGMTNASVQIADGCRLRLEYSVAKSMFGFSFYVADGKSVTVQAGKYELGDQQTLAHQDADGNWVLNEIPDYGEQLRRCQRYFVNFNPYKMSYFGMPPGVSSNSTMIFSNVTLPVAMRAQPVVSYGGTIYASQQGNIPVTGISVTDNTFNGISVQLKYTVDDGLTANSMYRMQGGKDTSSYIHLSADL